MALLLDWRLTKEPFPHAGKSLAPQTDPSQRGYYLDFYNWNTGNLLGGLSPTGDIDVSALRMAETVTVLISGTAGSGRSSVKNLLLYALEQAATQSAGHGHTPFILDIPVEISTNQQPVAVALSLALITQVELRNPAAGAALDKALERWQRLTGPGAADVASLFQMLRTILAQHLPGEEIIVVLDASSHALTRDAARATNAMLKGFAQYVIMALTKADDALFIRNELAGKQTMVWVDAPKVPAALVKGYVAQRNAAHRAPGYVHLDPHFPFRPAAIDYLFQATKKDGSEELAIGIVLEKLNRAMRLKSASPGHPPSEITEADMKGWFG